MKKILTFIALSVITFSISAQVSSVGTSGELTNPFKTSTGALKFYDFNYTTSLITIYNDDFSIFKTVDVPTVVGGSWNCFRLVEFETMNRDKNIFGLFSDNLFNSDSKIEFIIAIGDNSEWENSVVKEYKMINEDGIILQTIPINTNLTNVIGTHSILYSKSGDSYMTLNTDKDVFTHFKLNSSFDTVTGLFNSIKNVSNTASIYPNPASNYIKLDYTIPENLSVVSLKIFDMKGAIIKEMTVDGITGFVLLDINELKNGSYILKTMSGKELLADSKFVVLK